MTHERFPVNSLILVSSCEWQIEQVRQCDGDDQEETNTHILIVDGRCTQAQPLVQITPANLRGEENAVLWSVRTSGWTPAIIILIKV